MKLRDFIAGINEQKSKVESGTQFHKRAELGDLPDATKLRLAEFFGENSCAEVAVAGTIFGRFVSRRIDRVAVFDDQVLFLDFKTGGGTAADYAGQMKDYRALLAAVYPGRQISGFIYWVEKDELEGV